MNYQIIYCGNGCWEIFTKNIYDNIRGVLIKIIWCWPIRHGYFVTEKLWFYVFPNFLFGQCGMVQYNCISTVNKKTQWKYWLWLKYKPFYLKLRWLTNNFDEFKLTKMISFRLYYTIKRAIMVFIELFCEPMVAVCLSVCADVHLFSY